MTRDTPQGIIDIVSKLGEEEREVLLLLATRLLAGQVAYGKVNLRKDLRDFELERGMELADSLIYTAFSELQRLYRLRDSAQ